MDLQGIDIQASAIAPPQYFHWLTMRPGHGQRHAERRHLRDDPAGAERFVGIANLPMDHPKAAINESRRVNADLGFHGFEVNADVKGGDLDDRRFDPIWTAAEELEMLVILPPTVAPSLHAWPTTT